MVSICCQPRIEIVNWGPLTRRDNRFYRWTGEEHRGEVREGGGGYWEPYTDAQYTALIALVADLCQRHGVHKRFPSDGTAQFAPAEELRTFNGLLGHSAISAQKQDPGPLFDWDRLMKELGKGK